MIDDIMMQAEERMEKALGSLGDAFASVRTGRANAMVLDRKMCIRDSVGSALVPRQICVRSALELR